MLKIKKQIKNSDGTFIEIEGTEEEIERFEKKQKKKYESEQKRKEVLLGKTKKLKGIDVEELRKVLSEEIAKLQAIKEVHHWYYNNGWWWRPWYYGGTTVYLYSQTNPRTVLNGPVGDYYVAGDVVGLVNTIGVSEYDVTSKGNGGNYYSTNIWATNGTASNTNLYTTTYTAGTTSASGLISSNTISGGDSWSTSVDELQSFLGIKKNDDPVN